MLRTTSHPEGTVVFPALVFPHVAYCTQQLGRSGGHGLVLVSCQSSCEISRYGTGLYFGDLEQVCYRVVKAAEFPKPG